MLKVKVSEAQPNTKALGIESVIFVEGRRGAQYMFQRMATGETRFIIGVAARGIGKNCRPSQEVIDAAKAA